MTYELPAAPLSIGGVLDNAIRLYRDSIRRTWVIALLYSVVLFGFGLVFAVILGKGAVTPNKDPRQVFAFLGSPVVVAAMVIAMLVSMTLYGAMFKTLSAWARGDQSLSLGAAVGVGVRRLPAVLLGVLVNALAIGIGLLLLVIPGLYFIGKFPLWVAAVFVDDVSAMEGLRTSWRLTRGRWWRGAAIITVALIMIYVFGIAFGLVAGAIGVFAHLSVLATQVVSQLFSAISNIIVIPMFASILVVMYHDFKLRDEGGDLAARMGALDKV
jgi:hypothetical protein